MTEIGCFNSFELTFYVYFCYNFAINSAPRITVKIPPRQVRVICWFRIDSFFSSFAWWTSYSWSYFLSTPRIFQRFLFTIAGERLAKGHSRSPVVKWIRGTNRYANETTQVIIAWEERGSDVTAPLSPRQQLMDSRVFEKWGKWQSLLQASVLSGLLSNYF